MKAYVTKYALTEGIQHLDGELASSDARYFTRTDGRHGFFGPKDWTMDLAEAGKRAEAMRIKKIASLKKQIAKLEKLNFSAQAST